MNKLIKRIVIFVFILSIASFPAVNARAAKDTKKPSISLTPSTKSLTNKTISVTMKAKDASGIKTVKWAKGTQKTSYFKSKGTALKLSSKSTVKVSLKSNGTYSFYAVDKAGNAAVKTVKISNIDKTVPEISAKLSTTKPTNKSIKINVTAKDNSGIKTVKHLPGKKDTADFKEKGTVLKLSSGSGSIPVKANGTHTIYAADTAGNTNLATVSVKNIDTVAPSLRASYTVLNQKATVSVKSSDESSGIAQLLYVKGNVKDVNSSKWKDSAKEIVNNNFNAGSSGTYSILASDAAGNKTIEQVDIEMELKAVWISFFEFTAKDYSKSAFQKRVDTMFDNVVDLNMNAVVVHVRPFGDALYKSSYFPWSQYASGKQGLNPGYDPLEYMVEAAHERDLEIHAWLNPYRVTTSSTDYSKLSSDNPARKWKEDKDKTNDRNVLAYGGNLYYNPASKEVQQLITNGVTEIVKKYDVDGIHFDDYFYPNLGAGYKTNFDYTEYRAYTDACKKNGTTPFSIVTWRRNNVNTLVKNVYKAVKKLDSSVQFGISPAGSITNLKSNSSYYVDIERWLSTSDYVDYICPQIYWSFENATAPFARTVDNWVALRKSDTVKLYIGIANYRAGSNIEKEWLNSDDVLMRQILYSRDTEKVDGYMFFRYEHFFKKVCKPEVDNLMSVLQ